jgi:CheY-like chemotaxis protein/HPt (histidine-containing phosphotransfer) domain-containing protein
VIANFVSNAIKFTAAGEIVVAVTTASRTDEATVVRVEVSDTGIGIDPETLARLFTPFSQADSSTTRKYGGTGLGLAISRQLMDLMGGRVGAESRLGEGSRFWFELSLGNAAPADRRPDGEREIAGLRAVVVDDNAASRATLARQLRAWKLHCDVAESAPEALDLVDSAIAAGVPYGLGLIDIHMPDVGGRELARRLRAMPAGEEMHLVSLKPVGAPPDAPEDAAAFDGALSKPIRSDRLHTEVVAGKVGERPAVVRRAPNTGVEPAVVAEAAGPWVLIVEDTEVNQVVATLMLKRSGFRSQVAANGREALDALERGSFAAALMDCQMPILDGYETTREIRRREQGTRHLPIIAMTANSMQGERERCLAAGMDDYVTKPLRDRALQDALGRWITEPHAAAAESRGNGASGPPGGQADLPSLLDEAILAQLDELDASMLGSLLSLFSVQAAGNLADLFGAVDRGETASVAQTAHKLKGASGAIGAAHVSRLAGALEASAKQGDLTDASRLVEDLRDRLDQTVRELGVRARRSEDRAGSAS